MERAVTVISSALGARIDCDRCGQHVATASLSIEELRRASGYAQLDGRDYCPRCLKTQSTRGSTHRVPGRPTPADRG